MESLNENHLSAMHILVKIQRTLVKIEKMSIKGVLRVFILCITYGVIYMPSEYNMTSLEVSLILKISNLSSISNQYVGVSPKRKVDRSLSIFLIHLKIDSVQIFKYYISGISI